MKTRTKPPKEYKSASSTLYKFFISIGIIFVLIFIIFTICSFVLSSESTGELKSLYDLSVSIIPQSFVSLGAIFIAIGVIFYFFSCQFKKLAEIADEIEKSEEYIEENEL